MSNRYAADTMALILYLEKRKLPKEVSKIFSEIENGNIELLIPAMVIAEIGYLSERKRIDTNIEQVKKLIHDSKNVKIESMNLHSIEASFQIKTIPELHDRLIAATAAVCKATLITNDPIIISSGVVDTVW
jgi:predicted nucleic acid-binding protein